MYFLENVEDLYRENPQVMCIPRLEERTRLQVGEVVRIGLIKEGGSEAEKMWVRVETARGEGRYIGILLEKPNTVPTLNAGNHIEFKPEHVAEIYIDEADYRWFDDSKWAMVSLRIVEENAWPGRLMRIPTPDDQYSGWFLLKGDEDRHYMGDMSNFHPFLLSDCVGRCAVLKSILWSEIGSDWKWDEENAEYRVNVPSR